MLGWFELPAMPDNGGEGAPAADNLRTLGGPDHHPLALVNRDADKTALCIDFLKYLFSPTGFDEYYKHYKNLGKVCAMQCYLKDYTLPEEVTIEGKTSFDGDCSTNPYALFANYFTENAGLSTTAERSRRLSITRSRNICGRKMRTGLPTGKKYTGIISSGFGNYAQWRGLKWTSLTIIRLRT